MQVAGPLASRGHLYITVRRGQQCITTATDGHRLMEAEQGGQKSLTPHETGQLRGWPYVIVNDISGCGGW
jgi:hypothetical protein